ncbi:unnamed protein product [Orchesella dallaii]|uniref:Uncharacterized protein n=1 Tax=Orchesella dallaii TaxID=48710 RepID=A0ABP1Q1U4_9HEXA
MSRIINPSTPDNGLNDNDETEFYPVLSFSPHEFQVVNGQVRFVRSVAYNFHSCIQNTGGDSGGGNIPDTEIKWKSISPIDPLCGVNLEEKVVEYKVGDYMLQYRQDQPSVVQTREEAHSAYYATTLSKSRVCYIGSTLLVFISTGEKKRKAVFVLQFCQCHVCNEAWPWEYASYLDGDAKGFTQVEFDALSLKPVDMTIILKGEQELRYVKLTCE